MTRPVRCGIVLAAGEGMRLRPFIHRLRGDALPKQYVNFIGTRSMLEHTLHRAEKIIPPERLFTVVSESHLGYPEVRKQLLGRPRETVILQPENRETGPGLFLPLIHLLKRYPDSTIAVFPSDHFILEEDLFIAHVGLAFRVVDRYPDRIILLGVEPDRPEPQYGYVLPDAEAGDLASLGIRKVSRFIEKPDSATAGELALRGGLWNTLVMVFHAKTLLDIANRLAPRLYDSFRRIWEAIGSQGEKKVVNKAYRSMGSLNFSTGLLEGLPLTYPGHLSVLPLRGVLWSDWGSEGGVLDVLRRTGYLGRLNGVSEERLFRIWGGLDSRDLYSHFSGLFD